MLWTATLYISCIITMSFRFDTYESGIWFLSQVSLLHRVPQLLKTHWIEKSCGCCLDCQWSAGFAGKRRRLLSASPYFLFELLVSVCQPCSTNKWWNVKLIKTWMTVVMTLCDSPEMGIMSQSSANSGLLGRSPANEPWDWVWHVKEQVLVYFPQIKRLCHNLSVQNNAQHRRAFDCGGPCDKATQLKIFFPHKCLCLYCWIYSG